jgi:hypothetical protein
MHLTMVLLLSPPRPEYFFFAPIFDFSSLDNPGLTSPLVQNTWLLRGD